MREFNLLSEYPSSKEPRYVSETLRTIENRIKATYRDRIFFDGNRENGYGGFIYDGRWQKLAKKIIQEYNLDNNSSFLHINCEKGFLIHDLLSINEKINTLGVENSNYAIDKAFGSSKNKIIKSDYLDINQKSNSFDFVLAIGVVYAFNLKDAIKSIKEINRLSKKNSFITLASYNDKDEYDLFKKWTLLGTTILRKDEWVKVLKHCDYNGDYCFTNAKTLNLIHK